jgi:outer membrane cobalamin receptor
MRSRSVSRAAVVGLWAMSAIAAMGEADVAAGTQPPQAADDRVLRLGEIVVEARRETRDLLAAPTIESGALDTAVSTVDEEAIRLLDAGNAVEALDLSTGVFTEERGRKEKQLSSFRGQIYPYPDYALNGVWQRSFWEVPSFFPASAIGRIEVLRTGGAILVGPNSGLVGAINIVPRRFDAPTTLLDAQAGSFETYRASVVHGNRLAKGDYTVGANYFSTSGPKDENAGEDFTSLFGATAWDVGESVHVEFTAFGLTGERELRLIQAPGQKSLMNRKNEEFSPYTSYGVILRTLVRHGEAASTEFDAGYVLRDGDYSYQPGDLKKPRVQSDERDWEYNAGVLHARKLGEANTLRVGAQYNHWICPRGKRHFVGKRMDVETVSGVVVDEHQWDRLTLDGGVRMAQTYYRDYADASFNIAGDTLSGATIEDEWGDSALTGTFGAKYQVARRAALYAHAAAGAVDAPPGAVSETAKSLDRETRVIIDGGVSVNVPSLGRAVAGCFATLRQDAIVLTQTRVTENEETFNTYANREVRHYGVELEFRSAQALGALSLFGNATLMNSDQHVDGSWDAYREIPSVIALAGVNAAVGCFDANLFGKYVSRFRNKRFAEDGRYHDLGDFVDLNLTAGVSLGKQKATRIYVSLENLLDDDYSTVVGYPDYGFHAFGGVSRRF